MLLLLLPIRQAASQEPAAPAPVPAQSQEQPPTFARQVEAVTVDVVVVDKKGNPVTGLTKGDFTLLDEGQP